MCGAFGATGVKASTALIREWIVLCRLRSRQTQLNTKSVLRRQIPPIGSPATVQHTSILIPSSCHISLQPAHPCVLPPTPPPPRRFRPRFFSISDSELSRITGTDNPGNPDTQKLSKKAGP